LLDGAGTNWTTNGIVNVGGNGSGSLTLRAGATLSTLAGANIGGNSSVAGVTGAALVTDSGTQWTSQGFLNVGNPGATGNLTLQLNAQLNATFMIVGGFSPNASGLGGNLGIVTVDSGAHLTVANAGTGELQVGFTAGSTGLINIHNGGVVTAER